MKALDGALPTKDAPHCVFKGELRSAMGRTPVLLSSLKIALLQLVQVTLAGTVGPPAVPQKAKRLAKVIEPNISWMFLRP